MDDCRALEEAVGIVPTTATRCSTWSATTSWS